MCMHRERVAVRARRKPQDGRRQKKNAIRGDETLFVWWRKPNIPSFLQTSTFTLCSCSTWIGFYHSLRFLISFFLCIEGLRSKHAMAALAWFFLSLQTVRWNISPQCELLFETFFSTLFPTLSVQLSLHRLWLWRVWVCAPCVEFLVSVFRCIQHQHPKHWIQVTRHTRSSSMEKSSHDVQPSCIYVNPSR